MSVDLRTLLDFTGTYIFCKDLAGNYTYVNQKLQEFFAVPYEQIIGHDDSAFFDAETANMLRTNDRIVIDLDKTIEQEEVAMLKSTGIIRIDNVIKKPLRNDQGEIIGMCGIATDITDRKLAEAQLRIAAVAFESQEGMFVTDHRNVILKVNQAFCKITGYSAAEAVGHQPSLLSSGQHDKNFYVAMWECISKTGSWQGEIWDKRKNGEIYPQQMTITAVFDQQGAITNYVAVLADTTENKRSELQRLADEAAHRDALVREVHHRIKNNLQGVTGLLSNFAEKHPAITVPIREAISQVQSIAIIHGLQGRNSYTKVQLCEVIREIAAHNESLWNTTVLVDFPQNWPPHVLAENEAVPIAMICNELITNAIKHGDRSKGVTITLEHGLMPNAAQICICNIGQLPATLITPTFDVAQLPISNIGLNLIRSLLPKNGAHLQLVQTDCMVTVILGLRSPIVNIEKEA